MKTNLTVDPAAQLLKDAALTGSTTELRQRVLSVAQVQLLQAITEGAKDTEMIQNLLSIIQKLTLLELKEQDMAEKRALTETIRLNREELRNQERKEKSKAGQGNPPATPPDTSSKPAPETKRAPVAANANQRPPALAAVGHQDQAVKTPASGESR